MEARADIKITSSGRYTTSIVNRFVNQAYQQFMVMASNKGHLGFAKRTRVQCSTSGSDGAQSDWQANEYVAYPTDAFQILYCDVYDGNDRVPMHPFDRDERSEFDEYQGLTETKGLPRFWRAEGQTTGGTRIIQLIPRPDSAYYIVIHYIPVHTDITSDAGTFDGIAGWEEWVTNKAAQRILIQEGLTHTPSYSAMEADNRSLEEQITLHASRGRGVARMHNTRAKRRDLKRGYYRRTLE